MLSDVEHCATPRERRSVIHPDPRDRDCRRRLSWRHELPERLVAVKDASRITAEYLHLQIVDAESVRFLAQRWIQAQSNHVGAGVIERQREPGRGSQAISDELGERPKLRGRAQRRVGVHGEAAAGHDDVFWARDDVRTRVHDCPSPRSAELATTCVSRKMSVSLNLATEIGTENGQDAM